MPLICYQCGGMYAYGEICACMKPKEYYCICRFPTPKWHDGKKYCSMCLRSFKPKEKKE